MQRTKDSSGRLETYRCHVCGAVIYRAFAYGQDAPNNLEFPHVYDAAFSRKLNNPRLSFYYCWNARLRRLPASSDQTTQTTQTTTRKR